MIAIIKLIILTETDRLTNGDILLTILSKVVNECLDKARDVHRTRDSLGTEKQNPNSTSKLRTQRTTDHDYVLINANNTHEKYSNYSNIIH